jgi:phosphatidylglycerophosphatase A
LRRFLVHLLGTCGGAGYAPIAPATAGSFVVTVLWAAAWHFLGPVPGWLQAALIVAVTAIGIPIAAALEREHGEDPHLCVIDEVAGMLVTYVLVATTAGGWLVGFLWFRLFDILKPFGVRRLEALPGGVGIMADDVAAGAFACVATHVTVRLLGWTA